MGSLRLVRANALDTRPADVPFDVPFSGSQVHGWDGPSTYQNLDPAIDLANGDALTVSAWIKPDPAGFGDANPSIVDFGVTGLNGARMSFRLQLETGNIILRNEIAGANARVTVAAMSAGLGIDTLGDGNWHHIAMTVPQNGTGNDGGGGQGDVILYIDGVAFSGIYDAVNNPTGLTLGGATNPYLTGIGPVHVGDGINDANRDYNGWIDDVRIYDETLDATVIQALANDDAGSSSVISCFDTDSSSIIVGSSANLTWDSFTTDTLTLTDDQGGPALDVTGQTSASVSPTVTTTLHPHRPQWWISHFSINHHPSHHQPRSRRHCHPLHHRWHRPGNPVLEFLRCR